MFCFTFTELTYTTLRRDQLSESRWSHVNMCINAFRQAGRRFDIMSKIQLKTYVVARTTSCYPARLVKIIG